MRKKLSSGALAVMLSLALVSVVDAKEGGREPARVVAPGPCVEGICEYRLANGMRVLLFPDASKPTVTVNLVYGVGSMHENYGETGMAHLLEHMLFKGTPTHPDIPGQMQKRGVSKNASTSLDRTNYFASFPASDDTLDWLLGMEADRMVNSRIAKADLDSEMTVVRNEMEAGDNNPAGVLMKRMRSVAFDWHNYANMPIGARSDVENVPVQNLQGFYRTWYQPDNALLVVAGRIDSSKVLQRVAAHFGPLKKPARVLPAFHTVEPTQDGEREVTVRRSSELALVAASYHVPALAQADSAALAVLANVLGDNPNGRLYKALLETKLAAFAGASGESLHDPGLFTLISALPKDGDSARAEVELLKQAEGIAAQPVTEAEVAAAKQRIANGLELLTSDVNAVAMALSEYQAAGDWRLLFVQRDAIAKVSAADVNRVAAAYLKPSNRTLGRFVPTATPDRAQIPVAPAVASLVDGYAGKAAVDAGEAFEATLENIAERTQSFTIGNSLKVSLLPKKTRGKTVVLDATFRFGSEQSITGRADAGALVGPMLMMGSTQMDLAQIASRFDALGTQVQVSGGLQSGQIKLLGKRDTLAEALALAAQVLRSPAFPADQFEQLRLQAITGTEFQRTEPGALASMGLAQHFDPWPAGHPLHVESFDQSLAKLKALKVEELRAFHRDFYGTAEGEISVVGDFDAEALKAQLQALFAEWKSPVAYAPIATQYRDVAAKRATFSTPDKPNAIVLARQNLSLNLADADFAALNIAVVILGGDPLTSRLAERIRQKEGLSYGVGAGLSADESRVGRDDAGNITLQAIAAPENVAKVEAALREELVRLVRDGVTEQELRDAVSARLVAREQSRASDGTVAGILGDQLYYGRSIQFEIDRDAAYRALTVAQVNAAIVKHLKPERLSVFVAGDFK
ncbi:pitrilysin family protein [Stenotrophomonas sp. SY1]|uniref:M16 family metallopeptidase n=1 Tax=Stenotrophomonas sp. SY1 TaxID=477235 RepID=UPI001E31953A|nr:pitrilysin family protein [Stenotrophomonas sp. SY1]MCD9088100.1 insulinase family protein [Stenotrophomonas sp. SY1]